jgi:hypothetical protein
VNDVESPHVNGATKRPQAAVIGQVWVEHVARTRGSEPRWPTHEPRTLELSRSKVAKLAMDARMLEPLAIACSKSAATWWKRRPEHYRGSR